MENAYGVTLHTHHIHHWVDGWMESTGNDGGLLLHSHSFAVCANWKLVLFTAINTPEGARQRPAAASVCL